MKRSVRLLTILVLTVLAAVFLNAVVAFAKSMSDTERRTYMKTDSPMDKTPEVITLDKGENQARGAGKTAGYQLILDGSDWLLTNKGMNAWSDAYKVSVPSSIATALYKAGVIKNPTEGRNDAEAKQMGELDWYWKKTFKYEGTGKNVYICFDGVADRMEVYLNGTRVGAHQGMFGGPYIDVTEKIKKGDNELIVILRPVVNYTKTVVFNCSYAWHYADLPPIGIWNSVRIEDRADALLDSPFITTVSHETGTLDLSVDISDLSAGSKAIGGTLYCTISPKNFSGNSYSFTYKLSASGDKGDRNVRLRFDLPEFRLWWPNGYGEQNLYTLETLFVDDAGGRSYDSSDFGVRTLKMIATGRKESTNMYNRTAVFNGKTVFLKGADWCTIDATMNFTREDYDRILCRAYDQGLNVFRSWGGGMCETDEFYDLCDEYGLCVYQEWPCCWDSQKTQPKDVLYETVILNTKRIRNRASLLVYGGGNEGEAPTNDTVMNNIGMLTYKYDGTRDFWRQDGGVGAYGITHDHIHWGGETPEHYAEVYYNSTNNLHEYGLDSMMNMESIAKYATADEMAQWPIDPAGTIAYHTATFNGMKGWNQTPYGYDIDTFIHYASQFVEVTDLESLVTGSQIAQTMADYLAALNSRINFPKQSMVMVYKFNDVYPGASWSVVDYYGSPKMAYWFLQDVYAPLTAGLKADRYDTYNKTDKSLSFPVYVLDDADALSGADWEVSVKAYNNQFALIKETRYSGSGSVDMTKNVGEFTLTAAQTDTAPLFLVTTLYKNGVQTARTYMFMNAGKDPGCLFATPLADVTYSVSGNSVTLKNNSGVPAVAVNFDSGSASDVFRPADNFFWLEPGETYTFTVNDPSLIKGIRGFNMKDASDGSAPASPENLKTVSRTSSSVTISWNAPGDSKEIRYYELYINGALSGQIKGSVTEYTVDGLAELSEYDLELVAVDNGMNRSERGKTVTVKTRADLDAPYATRFEMTGRDAGTVWFSRKIDPESAKNVDYYVLNKGLEVLSAEPHADGYGVDLKFRGVSDDLSGTTLTVMGVRDTTVTGNPADRSIFYLDNLLLGYWPFEEEGELFTDGKFGKAITPGRSSYVLAESDQTLNNTVISFWIKGDTYSGFNVLLSKGAKIPGHFEIYTNEADLKLYCVDVCDSSFGVNLRKYIGEWTHLCFTCADKEVICWINGEKAGKVKLPDDIPQKSLELVIGSLPGGQYSFKGAIDEFYLIRSEGIDTEDLVRRLYENGFFREISFEKSYYKLAPGEQAGLAVIRKNTGDIEPLEWISSDPEVAQVDRNGTVTAAEKEGTALITVRSKDGQYVDRCLVAVGNFAEEEPDGPEQPVTRGNNTMLIVGIVLLAVAIAAAAFVAIMIADRRKEK